MTEHLYKVANARFGAGTEAGKEWVQASQWYLDRDLSVSVLNKIAEWQPETEADRQVRDTEYGYFAENQERMRYETFTNRGYHRPGGTRQRRRRGELPAVGDPAVGPGGDALARRECRGGAGDPRQAQVDRPHGPADLLLTAGD